MRFTKIKFGLAISKSVRVFLFSMILTGGVFAQQSEAFECVRSVPEPIFKKSFDRRRTFALRSNKDFPSEKIGLETIRFKNGDRLTVKNYGCENYSLDFRFVSGRFSGKVGDAKFWYRAAVELMRQTIKGLRESNLIVNGTRAIEGRLQKKRKPAFGEEIDFGGAEIRSVAIIGRPKKSRGNKFQIEISVGVGPL